ncbi:MAG: hypothetical protein NTV43_08900 [Methylococcales bacterium]|nr:hypothetical protein [Methylococcales bacterium]
MENLFNQAEIAIETHDSNMMKTLSLAIESELLLESTFPEWCFNLFTKLFKNDKFCSITGSEQFVWVIYNDFEKLSVRQSELLFNMFTTNYDRFKNKNLLHSLADFIARKYPPEQSLIAFQEALTQGSEASVYAALVGSEILAINKNASEKVKSIAENIIYQINGLSLR